MRIIVQNHKSKIQPENNKDFKILTKLIKQTRLHAPGYKYNPQYKRWLKTGRRYGWDGRLSIINPDGSFLTGLLPFFVSKLGRIEVSIKDERKNAPKTLKLKPPSVKLYDYQQAAIEAFFQNKIFGDMAWHRGVFHMATGSGKTETAIALVQMLDVPTIFFVHKLDLLKQTVERFRAYGIPTGIIRGSIFEPDQITVMTVQTAYSIFKNKLSNPKRWKNLENVFHKAKLEIWDEAHMIASSAQRVNIFTKVAAMNPYSYYRVGLTATPFMREEISNSMLEGATGQVIYKVTSKDLIDLGYLVNPKITMIEAKSSMKIPSYMEYKDVYAVGIVNNKERNQIIVEQVKNLPKPCLILVKMIDHGEILKSKLRQEGVQAVFLSGEHSIEYRKDKLNDLRTGRLDVVISTSIFDEGIDVPNLQSIILAGGGKSKVKAIQRLGRGLRTSHGKKEVHIIDFFDKSHPLLRNHSRARMKTWKDQGFDVDGI